MSFGVSLGADSARDITSELPALKAAGVTFLVRYLSWLPNPKVIGRAEAEAILEAGFELVLNWEYDAHDMLGGRANGEAHAAEADRQSAELGLPGAVVYFSNDNDSTPGDQVEIDAYLDGCANVRGLHLLGMYGGYWPLSRARAAGKATWWWGTPAWSADRWDPKANPGTFTPHIMQGGAFMGGAFDVDWSHAADIGQTPRPGPHHPPPSPIPPTDWQVKMMTRLPTLAQGAHGDPVRRAQALLNVASGPGARLALVLDGQFGAGTHAAVEAFQTAHHLAADGVIGKHTWAVLVTGADL